MFLLSPLSAPLSLTNRFCFFFFFLHRRRSQMDPSSASSSQGNFSRRALPLFRSLSVSFPCYCRLSLLLLLLFTFFFSFYFFCFFPRQRTCNLCTAVNCSAIKEGLAGICWLMPAALHHPPPPSSPPPHLNVGKRDFFFHMISCLY